MQPVIIRKKVDFIEKSYISSKSFQNYRAVKKHASCGFAGKRKGKI